MLAKARAVARGHEERVCRSAKREPEMRAEAKTQAEGISGSKRESPMSVMKPMRELDEVNVSRKRKQREEEKGRRMPAGYT